MTHPNANALLEVSIERDMPDVLDDKKMNEIRIVFEILDKHQKGMVSIGQVSTLLRCVGLSVEFEDVYDFMTADCSKKTESESIKELTHVSYDTVLRIARWSVNEEHRAGVLYKAFQKLDHGEDGYCPTTHGLVLCDAACFSEDLNRLALSETILQKSVFKYDDLNLRRLVRHYKLV
jgi:Ca2+-binding EF-hand superfamily protein